MQNFEGVGEEEIPSELRPLYDRECAAAKSELINLPEEV